MGIIDLQAIILLLYGFRTVGFEGGVLEIVYYAYMYWT